MTEISTQKHASNLAETVIGSISVACSNNSRSTSDYIYIPEGKYLSRIHHQCNVAAGATGNSATATSTIYFNDGTTYDVGTNSMSSACWFNSSPNGVDYRPTNSLSSTQIMSVEKVYCYVRVASYDDDTPGHGNCFITVYGMELPWQSE